MPFLILIFFPFLDLYFSFDGAHSPGSSWKKVHKVKYFETWPVLKCFYLTLNLFSSYMVLRILIWHSIAFSTLMALLHNLASVVDFYETWRHFLLQILFMWFISPHPFWKPNWATPARIFSHLSENIISFLFLCMVCFLWTFFGKFLM